MGDGLPVAPGAWLREPHAVREPAKTPGPGVVPEPHVVRGQAQAREPGVVRGPARVRGLRTVEGSAGAL